MSLTSDDKTSAFICLAYCKIFHVMRFLFDPTFSDPLVKFSSHELDCSYLIFEQIYMALNTVYASVCVHVYLHIYRESK